MLENISFTSVNFVYLLIYRLMIFQLIAQISVIERKYCSYSSLIRDSTVV